MKKWHLILIIFAITGGTVYWSSQQPIANPNPAPETIQEPIVSPTAPIVQTGCDQNLWTFVYHPDRLPTKNDCRSVSGIVKWDKVEPDGDFHIRLQLDDPNSAPVNNKNIGGYLVVEPVCQIKNITQSDAVGPCSGYNGPLFPLPSVGSHIQVSGFYTLDAQHGWQELHAVSSITVLQ